MFSESICYCICFVSWMDWFQQCILFVLRFLFGKHQERRGRVLPSTGSHSCGGSKRDWIRLRPGGHEWQEPQCSDHLAALPGALAGTGLEVDVKQMGLKQHSGMSCRLCRLWLNPRCPGAQRWGHCSRRSPTTPLSWRGKQGANKTKSGDQHRMSAVVWRKA